MDNAMSARVCKKLSIAILYSSSLALEFCVAAQSIRLCILVNPEMSSGSSTVCGTSDLIMMSAALLLGYREAFSGWHSRFSAPLRPCAGTRSLPQGAAIIYHECRVVYGFGYFVLSIFPPYDCVFDNASRGAKSELVMRCTYDPRT